MSTIRSGPVAGMARPPTYPRWPSRRTPPLSSIFMQTAGQATLQLSDLPGPAGGILIKTLTGAMIMVNDVGITISNGKGASIVMAGPTVTINAGALVIT